VIQRLWTPEDTLADRAHRDRAPYDIWVQQGWLQATPGTRIDHTAVIEALGELRQKYRIQKIGFDPWHADKVIDDLKREPWVSNPDETVIEVPQTFLGMSSACLRVQAEILSATIDAGGCPVTGWAVSNAAGQTDGKDNLMFVKKKSRGRIDPVISMTMAMALWLRHANVEPPKYEILVFGGR
jgi:phage terminase large subunit-like protein